MAFQLIAGDPSLDFINTLDWRFGDRQPEDLLKNYDDLLRFSEQSKLVAPRQTRPLRRLAGSKSAAEALQHCRELREALAEIFYARLDRCEPSAEARTTLEAFVKAARLRQKFNWTRSPHLEWEWPPGENDAALPLWALAMSAADLMTSEAVHRVRACDNSECRWLFLDTSKNHTRRWCDMRLCGNRMKARRFKAQRKG